MHQLPTELWLRVAHYIPDIDLFRLASVNRFFLDLATDRRYRELIIDDDDPMALIQKLKKLHNDTVVAGRVRSLTIHPKAVRSACLKSRKYKDRNNYPVRAARSSYWPDPFRLVYDPQNPFGLVFNTLSSFRTAKVAIEEDVELGDQILEAFSHLHSVQEYSVEWKVGNDIEASFCVPLLIAIWPLHAHNLRTIRLELMLRHLCDLVSSVTGLDRVQVLFLHFTSGEDDSKKKLGELAIFINTLAPTLQSLTISSIGHLNFSWLYSSLTYFPHLTYLSLLLPCDPRHITDPTGFNQFLRTHCDIAHLSFSPQYCCYQSAQTAQVGSAFQPAFLPSNDWLDKAFENVSFQNLDTLELGLNIFGSGGKRVMLPIPRVASAANFLYKLSIVGCFISLDELRGLLEPFPNVPRSLVLEVHVLSVPLLDLLADLLPDLEMLDLTYRWVDRVEETNSIYFSERLKDKQYSSWKLSNLILRCSRQNDDARWPCQQAIARSIPGLCRRV